MTKMKIQYLGNLRTECTHESGASFDTDAPKDNGGEGKLFSPTDLVAVGLASCMITMMGLAAKKLGIDLKISAETEKMMSVTAPRRIGKIIVRMRSPLALDANIREKLEKAAMDCPVHYSLHPEVKLEFDFVWGL